MEYTDWTLDVHASPTISPIFQEYDDFHKLQSPSNNKRRLVDLDSHVYKQ